MSQSQTICKKDLGKKIKFPKTIHLSSGLFENVSISCREGEGGLKGLE